MGLADTVRFYQKRKNNQEAGGSERGQQTEPAACLVKHSTLKPAEEARK
jgi:hypothetical protein